MKKKNNILIIIIMISLSSLSLSARIAKKPAQRQTIKQHAAQEQTQAKATLTTATDSNEHLVAILKNSQFLAEQIRTNTFDHHEGQNAAHLIVDAEKKLSPAMHASVKQHISSLIHEYTLYSKTPGLKRKTYDKTKAEAALQSLASIIKHTTANTAESVVSQASGIVQGAIAETEKIIKKAQLIINETEQKVEEETITPAKAARIIGQQQRIILDAEKTLQQTAVTAQEVVMQSDQQTGYLSWLANGAYNVAQSVIAPFKAGYGYSDEEKETARSIIAQLEQQKIKLTKKYQTAMKQPTLSERQKDTLTEQYTDAIKDLQNELYEQQVITGDAMSLNRKLFWGTVAAATAGLGYYYFTKPPAYSDEEWRELWSQQQQLAAKADVTKSLKENFNETQFMMKHKLGEAYAGAKHKFEEIQAKNLLTPEQINERARQLEQARINKEQKKAQTIAHQEKQRQARLIRQEERAEQDALLRAQHQQSVESPLTPEEIEKINARARQLEQARIDKEQKKAQTIAHQEEQRQARLIRQEERAEQDALLRVQHQQRLAEYQETLEEKAKELSQKGKEELAKDLERMKISERIETGRKAATKNIQNTKATLEDIIETAKRMGKPVQTPTPESTLSPKEKQQAWQELLKKQKETQESERKAQQGWGERLFEK